MHKSIKVSIAMATYNGEKYIQQQLESFLAQTRLPDELIISDDGSTDKTLEIINKFTQTAPFEIRVINNTNNHGCARNFNNALLNCTGDLIFLADQDDFWLANKIQTMIRNHEINPDYSVYMNDTYLADENLNNSFLTKYTQMKNQGLPDSEFIMGCCCMIKKDFLKKVLPIPSCVKIHDSWLVPISDSLNSKFIFKEPLQLYRRHGSNVSNSLSSSLNKVGAIRTLIHNLKKSLNFKARLNPSKAYPTGCFYNGLKSVKHQFRDSQLFQQLLESERMNYMRDRKRIFLRKMSFIKRLFTILKIYKYERLEPYSLKNVIRDLIG